MVYVLWFMNRHWCLVMLADGVLYNTLSEPIVTHYRKYSWNNFDALTWRLSKSLLRIFMSNLDHGYGGVYDRSRTFGLVPASYQRAPTELSNSRFWARICGVLKKYPQTEQSALARSRRRGIFKFACNLITRSIFCVSDISILCT